MPRPFRPFRKRSQSPPPTSPAGPAQDPSRVRSRLHALFTPNGSSLETEVPSAGPSRSPSPIYPTDGSRAETTEPSLFGGTDVARAFSEPVPGLGHDVHAEQFTVPEQPDREAIKVLIVTWNMGDALPKGDLSVLLGHIPPYQPPLPSDDLPQLPVENAHPYHIVVIAGQECPTPSGAPRGLGGGLMKGVTLRHKREAREKEKDKEKEKEKRDGTAVDPTDKDSEEGRSARSPLPGSDENGEYEQDAQRSCAASPVTPHTPFLHRQPPATKGWSQMLDDYFYGPGARTDGMMPSMTPSPRDSPSPFPPHTGGFPGSQPILLRSASAPITPTAPISIPNSLAAPSTHLHPHMLSPSPLARSRSSFDSTSSSSSSEVDRSFFVPHTSHDEHLQSSSAPLKPRVERPEIVIPVDEPLKTAAGNGSYVHVVKERLLGMYLTIYVYKGCEHLIQGLDKDYVTAGLAGGRVGNKGGIGISLKLADHRFLFVNSHLAAHAGRQAARLANIAKIKEELRLDCFLPKEDPRASLPDLTDRFDTVFWCGDLNFRLELSRLHADWLIEQKKYTEALMWDQLRLAMNDPEANPFPGFEEGQIDFPCTFKYDVWKSVRATNRDLGRTLRRRKSAASAAQVDGGTSMTAHNNLSGVPEGDDLEEVIDPNCEEKDQLEESFVAQRDSEEEYTDAGLSRHSFESSRYTSAAPSTAGTDIEDGESDDIPPFGQQAHKHRPLEQAIKEKTRHLLGLVKMDGILPSTPKRGPLGRRVSKPKRNISLRRRQAVEDDFDAQSRRSSMSSIVSRDDPPQARSSYEGRRISSSATHSKIQCLTGDPTLSVPTSDSAKNSDTSNCSSSPPKESNRPPLTKRVSLMKRTMSGISTREDVDEDDDDPIGTDVDNREGVYDTSKKQRVPSWCDRVLWKAHVVPDPEPEAGPSNDFLDVPSLDRDRPLTRLSAAFANFGGHFRSMHMGRTASMDVPSQDRGRGMPSEVSFANQSQRSVTSTIETTLVASPPGSPTVDAESPLESPGLIPAPRRASPARSPSRLQCKFPYPISQSSPLSRPSSPTRIGRGLRGTKSDMPSPELAIDTEKMPSYFVSQSTPEQHHSMIMVDSPSSPTVERLRVTLSRSSRPRSNSDVVVGGAAQPSLKGEAVDEKNQSKRGRVSDGHLTNSPARLVPTHAKTLAVLPRPEMGSGRSYDRPISAQNILSGTNGCPPLAPPLSTDATLTPTPSKWLPSSERQNSPKREQLHHSRSGPTTSESNHPNGNATLRESDKNAFVRFLRDLPGWLHVRASTVPGERTSAGEAVSGPPAFRRHQQGEVVCLHYGTIDDAGMRQLEGRSDHRPAIFSAAVYV